MNCRLKPAAVRSLCFIRKSYGNKSGFLSILLVASGMVKAQDSAKTTVTAFVDVYYSYCFLNQPPELQDRGFTTQPLRHNEFNLNLGMVDVKYLGDNARGTFALQTGTYVQANYAAEPTLLKNILEASVGARCGKQVWVDMGIFPSHIGWEGAISKDNWTYSRSLLADYSPYYESGLSVTATISGNLTVRGLLLNGWQNIAETNKSKAFGTQLQYTPQQSVLFNWSTFFGNEQPDTSVARPRIFNDLYCIIAISPEVSLSLVGDVGMQRRTHGDRYDVWHAASVTTQYRISRVWRMAGCVEYYLDRFGVIIPTGTKNNFQVYGASANVDFAPDPGVLWRVEARLLNSRDAIFETADGRKNAHGFVVLSASISME